MSPAGGKLASPAARRGSASATGAWPAWPPGSVIVSALLEVRAGRAPGRAARSIDSCWRSALRRSRSTSPSCGSVFKNPPGSYAGRLIEAAGLKGARAAARRSRPLHANFIVNTRRRPRGRRARADRSRARRACACAPASRSSPRCASWGRSAVRRARLARTRGPADADGGAARSRRRARGALLALALGVGVGGRRAARRARCSARAFRRTRRAGAARRCVGQRARWRRRSSPRRPRSARERRLAALDLAQRARRRGRASLGARSARGGAAARSAADRGRGARARGGGAARRRRPGSWIARASAFLPARSGRGACPRWSGADGAATTRGSPRVWRWLEALAAHGLAAPEALLLAGPEPGRAPALALRADGRGPGRARAARRRRARRQARAPGERCSRPACPSSRTTAEIDLRFGADVILRPGPSAEAGRCEQRSKPGSSGRAASFAFKVTSRGVRGNGTQGRSDRRSRHRDHQDLRRRGGAHRRRRRHRSASARTRRAACARASWSTSTPPSTRSSTRSKRPS